MALDTSQRDDSMRLLVQRMFVESNITAQLTSAEVRQLVDDIDDWLEANVPALNTSIRVGLRAKATTVQKALALAVVAMRRGGGG